MTAQPQFLLVDASILERLEGIERAIRKMSQPHDGWMSVNDYAKHVGKSRSTVERWLREGSVQEEYRGQARGIRVSPDA